MADNARIMPARDLMAYAEPRRSLHAFDRLAPGPSAEAIAAQIETHSRPGEIVVDLHGRGGWVARPPLYHQRVTDNVQSRSLQRLLAKTVLHTHVCLRPHPAVTS